MGSRVTYNIKVAKDRLWQPEARRQEGEASWGTEKRIYAWGKEWG